MASAPEFPAPPAIGFLSDILDIPYPDDKVFVDYIFVNNTRLTVQLKTRIFDEEPKTLADVPEWDMSMFDDWEFNDPRPEMIIRPVAMFRDPFRKGKNKIVLCEFFDFGKEDVPMINTRAPLREFFGKKDMKDLDVWVGYEQEYFIVDKEGVTIGWDFKPGFVDNWRHTSLDKGHHSGLERQFCEYHTRACMYAGLKIFSIAREEACGQWEYALGPGPGVEMCDHLIVSRYLLHRCAEIFGIHVTLDPKPVAETVWASGVHLNYSTRHMRADGGYSHIEEAVQRLSLASQDEILKHYDRTGGADNRRRMIGDHFIPSAENFVWGVADKFANIRIPPKVAEAKKGYLEERRPCSNCDPYLVLYTFMKALYTDEFLQKK